MSMKSIMSGQSRFPGQVRHLTPPFLVIVFIFFQRQIVSGMTAGAVKGWAERRLRPWAPRIATGCVGRPVSVPKGLLERVVSCRGRPQGGAEGGLHARWRPMSVPKQRSAVSWLSSPSPCSRRLSAPRSRRPPHRARHLPRASRPRRALSPWRRSRSRPRSSRRRSSLPRKPPLPPVPPRSSAPGWPRSIPSCRPSSPSSRPRQPWSSRRSSPRRRRCPGRPASHRLKALPTRRPRPAPRPRPARRPSSPPRRPGRAQRPPLRPGGSYLSSSDRSSGTRVA